MTYWFQNDDLRKEMDFYSNSPHLFSFIKVNMKSKSCSKHTRSLSLLKLETLDPIGFHCVKNETSFKISTFVFHRRKKIVQTGMRAIFILV